MGVSLGYHPTLHYLRQVTSSQTPFSAPLTLSSQDSAGVTQLLGSLSLLSSAAPTLLTPPPKTI